MGRGQRRDVCQNSPKQELLMSPAQIVTKKCAESTRSVAIKRANMLLDETCGFGKLNAPLFKIYSFTEICYLFLYYLFF